ncbi:MAG TPA: hypothetical protein VIK77_13000 [Tissierellaceae bacterium]
MVRKKRLINKTILKKLDELEIALPADKPIIAFMGKLPDGKYEVTEHYWGKNERGIECTVKYVDKIVDSKEEYFSSNPNYLVIIDDIEDDLPMVDMLKRLDEDEEYRNMLIKKANERMIKK